MQEHDPVGETTAPSHYARERETIDTIRDVLGDEGFKAFCVGNAIKYFDRAGRKGDAQEDLKKADWYSVMFEHLRRPHAHLDPRCRRVDFEPYSRPYSAMSEESLGLLLKGLRAAWLKGEADKR